MNSEVMNPGNEKLKIYETVLSSPGRGEKCKIILQLSGQNILLLARIIELGLEVDKKEMNGDILMLLTEGGAEEFDFMEEQNVQLLKYFRFGSGIAYVVIYFFYGLKTSLHSIKIVSSILY